MRVSINPQFFRQWYDRLATPIIYGGAFAYGDVYEEEVTDPYIVPEGRFALILSLTIYAFREDLWGPIGYISTNIEVALRESPDAYDVVWAYAFRVGPKGRHGYSDIGHMGFLREGDRLRWHIYSYPQGGYVHFVARVWLVEYLFQG